jgi:death-on-curing protein
VNLEFVRADVLRNVHGRLLERYGGVAGIRDENGLEAAVARPQNLQFYSNIESIPILGAALVWSLLRNHPFADGNKRTAFAALTIFLDRNGYGISCSEVEETGMMKLAAGSEMTEEELAVWIDRSIAPRT